METTAMATDSRTKTTIGNPVEELGRVMFEIHQSEKKEDLHQIANREIRPDPVKECVADLRINDPDLHQVAHQEVRLDLQVQIHQAVVLRILDALIFLIHRKETKIP
ncbi:hypothetical protein CAEBREN_25772 [Caenorhabditis brenneri]|uniref:Uncharacterized protein n=1 Tax=Caenorhabditis brenneri TaxID=135651 RepID=G0PJN9_CAEBE|nr:hypothetical protein CAEBREN_25772 [Caenorhabditis brenneri]